MRIESGEPGRKLALWAGSIALVVVTIALVGGTPARGVPPPAAGAAEPVAVLTGSYSCDVNDVLYYIGEPGGEPQTFRELSDRISIASTGGVTQSLPGLGGIGAIGPGFGGRTRVPPAAPDIGGLATGHSFNGGAIEDCLRFAETVAGTARGLGCVVSEVRHRQRVYSTETVTLSFVCEGPVAAQLHGIGELARAVVTLKPLPAP